MGKSSKKKKATPKKPAKPELKLDKQAAIEPEETAISDDSVDYDSESIESVTILDESVDSGDSSSDDLKTAESIDEAKKAPEISPSFGSYVKAVLQMVAGWIKAHKLKALGLLILVVVLAVSAVFLLKPGPSQMTSDEIVVRVSKELGITGDSNPVFLTVVDDSKIEQPFLDQAKNDDRVILYYKAKKAVLFRPSENRIIHHGAYTPPEAKVFIRRGTEDVARVDNVKNQLEDIDGVKLSSEDISSRKDYQGVTLVSVTDRYDDKIRELENIFDVEVVRLPAGESFPDADILIIVGS